MKAPSNPPNSGVGLGSVQRKRRSGGGMSLSPPVTCWVGPRGRVIKRQSAAPLMEILKDQDQLQYNHVPASSNGKPRRQRLPKKKKNTFWCFLKGWMRCENYYVDDVGMNTSWQFIITACIFIRMFLITAIKIKQHLKSNYLTCSIEKQCTFAECQMTVVECENWLHCHLSKAVFVCFNHWQSTIKTLLFSSTR